jgi:hypothetical protein
VPLGGYAIAEGAQRGGLCANALPSCRSTRGESQTGRVPWVLRDLVASRTAVGGIRRADHVALSIRKKLPLTWPTCGGRSRTRPRTLVQFSTLPLPVLVEVGCCEHGYEPSEDFASKGSILCAVLPEELTPNRRMSRTFRRLARATETFSGLLTCETEGAPRKARSTCASIEVGTSSSKGSAVSHVVRTSCQGWHGAGAFTLSLAFRGF